MTNGYSFTYSIPYLLSGIFLFVLAYTEYKLKNKDDKKRKIRHLCWIFFIFFFGFRGFVAYDWFEYYKVFRDTGNIFNLSKESFVKLVDMGDVVEPFFVLYISIIKTLFNNWSIFVLISSFIDLIVINYLFKKYSPNYAFSMLLFFAMSITLEFDAMRNAKALIIFLLSLDSIYNRKFIKFCILVFIGFMFHRSMLLFFPFYFIANVKSTKNTLIILFIILNVIYFSRLELAHFIIGKYISIFGGEIGEKAYWYSVNQEISSTRGFTMGYFSRSITYFLIVFYYNQIVNNFKYGKLFINAYLTYFVMTFAFSDFKVFIDRIELIFSFSYWFIWPYIIYCIKKQQIKSLLFVGMIIFCFLKIFKQTNNIMYDYENILTGSSSYNERISSHFNHKNLLTK